MKYRKKPVVVEAVQWRGDNISEVLALMPFDKIPIVISTLEGNIRVEINDWIIKGTQGEFYPCKPAIFAEVYEPVEE